MQAPGDLSKPEAGDGNGLFTFWFRLGIGNTLIAIYRS